MRVLFALSANFPVNPRILFICVLFVEQLHSQSFHHDPLAVSLDRRQFSLCCDVLYLRIKFDKACLCCLAIHKVSSNV